MHPIIACPTCLILSGLCLSLEWHHTGYCSRISGTHAAYMNTLISYHDIHTPCSTDTVLTWFVCVLCVQSTKGAHAKAMHTRLQVRPCSGHSSHDPSQEYWFMLSICSSIALSVQATGGCLSLKQYSAYHDFEYGHLLLVLRVGNFLNFVSPGFTKFKRFFKYFEWKFLGIHVFQLNPSGGVICFKNVWTFLAQNKFKLVFKEPYFHPRHKPRWQSRFEDTNRTARLPIDVGCFLCTSITKPHHINRLSFIEPSLNRR